MSEEVKNPEDTGSAASPCSTTSPQTVVTIDDEIIGLRKICEALEGKDKATCARMLDWAADVFTDSVLMPGCKRGRDLPRQGS